MEVPANLKAHVLDEFDQVLQVLRSGASLEEKLYYYSAIFGAIYRVMNIQPSNELIFVHHVLNTVHTAFQARLQAIKRDAERPVMIEEPMVEKLVQLMEKLRESIALGTDSTDICKNLTVLAYATTGNGYYLYKKGDLVL
jgi:hypothetical protein